MRLFILDPEHQFPRSFGAGLKRCNVAPVEIARTDLESLAISGVDPAIVLVPEQLAITVFQTLAKMTETGRSVGLLAIQSEPNAVLESNLLNAGIDDVVCVDAPAEVVIARAAALFRHMSGLVDNAFTLRGLHIDRLSGAVTYKGEPLGFTGKESMILRILASNPQRPVTKKNLYHSLYSLSLSPPYPKVIDVFIHRIRKRLKDVSGEEFIVTVSAGQGYRML